MKFLEVKQGPVSRGPKTENKMKEGTREGQRPPISTLRAPEVHPDAQKLADELHVDLSTVKGTGKHGRIVSADVRKAAEELS